MIATFQISTCLYNDREMRAIWDNASGEWRFSVPVNPLFAHAMYLKEDIEKTGTGTEDMIAQCTDWGIAAPEWIEDDEDS